MFIDINKIAPEGLSFDEVVRVGALEGVASRPIIVRQARLRGEAMPGKRGVDLRAHLDSTVIVECSRCTEPFEVPMSIDFFLTLVPGAAGLAAGEAQMDPEDATLFEAPEGRADLVAMTIEQIYLNLPLKPVCVPDCRGLCPACGVNRNRTECACVRSEIDPRLAPLLQFKKRR
jgi:uncharacterized protein